MEADQASKAAASENRAKWSHGLEFVMSCVAMCVGLGNVWRFPFTAYTNGGGAFLIPYLCVLLTVGQPLYFMEMALGQFCSGGNVKMFQTLKPGLIGVGIGQMIGTSLVASYYCSLMAIIMIYFGFSFTSKLPWSSCDPEWKLPKNMTCVAALNKESKLNGISSSELWFTQEILKEITNIDDGIGWPEWRLTICLFLSWIATYIVSVKGVHSSGKAAYFLVLFPYIILICLLGRASTLEGSIDGIIFFYTPVWSKLADAHVWYAAVTQCFFSLNVGFGSIIMYSSYNTFHHNIQRDALIITCIDTMTSLMAGTTIFGILGNLAHELNVDVKDVVNSGGTGLAFISYPDAISKFHDVPWLFSILFFLMLLVLGVGSLVGLQGVATTAILDAWPTMKDWQASAITASIGFVIGLVYITPGGQFILNVVDHFGGTFIVIIFVIVEILTVTWWYGLRNFCLDIEFMIRRKVNPYWRFMWGLFTPLILLLIFFYFCVKLKRLQYGSYEIADWALGCGWAILGVCIVQVFIWIFYHVHKNKQLGFKGSLAKSFTSENWSPLDPDTSDELKKFKDEKLLESKELKHSYMGGVARAFIGKP